MSLNRSANPTSGEPLRRADSTPAEQLERIELHRPELLALSESMFEAKRFAEFRAHVTRRWRGWRSSPTAVVLVGLSYFQEDQWEQAREFVDSAEELWTGLGSMQQIDGVTVELVRSSLACCRAIIELGEKDADAARRVLNARVDEVKANRSLSPNEQAQVIGRITSYLADKRMRKLAKAKVVDCIVV